MTPQEQRCRTLYDVVRLAHERTVIEVRRRKKRGELDLVIDCRGINDCGESGQHKTNSPKHYSQKAQVIFNRHYEHIRHETGI